ncbi:MAG: hypothetical protein HKO62_05460 [Gammaproteobacteria bacterium]|nr:hypothetical protein [Gammaproteobacteria bacterium]NNM00176.1 hypothetical protein [Gammaproteobacteria bacterium]
MMLDVLKNGLLIAALTGPAAVAAIPIVYDGELIDDLPATGSVRETGTAFGDLLGGDWWYFSGRAGDSITLAVDRLDGGLDAALIVRRGMISNTDLISASPGTVMLGNGVDEIASADDEAPANLPGPFGDPETTFILPARATYSILVWSFMSPVNGDYRYSIRLSRQAVSAPATPLLLGIGLALAGLHRRAIRRD